MRFYALELTAFKPGVTTYTFAQGHGTHPHGALAELPDVLSASGTIYASDTGYRTLSTDPSGIVVYPPVINSAFTIVRAVNLDPAASAVAAAAGQIRLANADGMFDGIAASWNSDGRAVRVLRGDKRHENFPGYNSNRSTIGTYIDVNGVMQVAAAFAVRTDYTTGVPVTLNESAATNTILNSDAAAWAGNGTSTVVSSTAIPNLLASATVFKCNTNASGTAVNAGAIVNALTTTSGQTYAMSLWVWVPSAFAGTLLQMQFAATGLGIGNADLSKRGQWQRVGVTFTAPSTTTTNMRQVVTSGVATDFFYVTCPQFETAGPTSYISSGATAVTRAADKNYLARDYHIDPSYSTLTLLFAGMATPWFLTDTELQIPVRDATYWLEQPIQSVQYQGTGTYEGPAALLGQDKPKTRGAAFNVTPVLVDPAFLIYQYNDAAGTVAAMYEGGATTYAFSSDTTNLYSGSTAAGHYRTDNSRGLFQLGSSPTYAITADVTGQFPTAGTITNAATIARYLLTEDASLPAGNLDTASFTAAATAYPYAGGVYFGPGDAPDGVAAVSRVLASFGALLMPKRDGTLTCFVLRALSGATPVASFNLSNVVTLIPTALPAGVDPPPYRFRVGYAHNYTVQTSGLNPTTSAARVGVLAVSDQYAGWSSGAVLTAYRRPTDPLPIGGALTAQADSLAVANALGALWGVRRRLYVMTVPVSLGVLRELGDVISLTWPMDNLATGQLGQIVGETFNSQDATIAFTVLV